jgi:hypothetical protein
MRQRKLQLATQLEGVRKIYLDTNYWVSLRDTCLGRSRGRVYDELYATLHKLVSSGAAICPISGYTWFELDRQTDSRTRIATARLIDELSRGVGIESPDERFRIELLNFMVSSVAPHLNLIPPKQLVWTKASYLLGNHDPFSRAFDPDDMVAFQKAWFDMYWEVPLAEIFARLDPGPSGKSMWEAVAREQTQGKIDYPATGRSFKDILMDEIHGVVEASPQIIDDVTAYCFSLVMNKQPTETDLADIRSSNLFSNLIRLAFQNDKITTELPGFRIYASLHAAVRMDTERRFKPNDQYDFGHAAAALPYCDAFLTEGSLRHLIMTPPVALHRLYGTTVISDPHAALEYLTSDTQP